MFGRYQVDNLDGLDSNLLNLSNNMLIFALSTYLIFMTPIYSYESII